MVASSDTSWEDFVKHGKKSWDRRKAMLSDCHRRKGFTNLNGWWRDIELMEPSLKGKSKKQKRTFILLNTVTLAEVWGTGFKKLTKDKQEAVEQVFERDEQRRKRGRRP